MNNYITAIDGWNNKKVYYQDTDSLYIHQSSLKYLIEAGYYHDTAPFCGKNDLASEEKDKNGNPVPVNPKIVQAIFLGPKQKIVRLLDDSEQVVKALGAPYDC